MQDSTGRILEESDPPIHCISSSRLSRPQSIHKASSSPFSKQEKREKEQRKMLLTGQFINPLSLSAPSLSPMKPLSNLLPPSQLTIRALKPIHGKVVTNVNDKTVNVQVIRYRICPVYKKRMRIKTKYQAHDPENQFKIGDLVTLEKCRPISKTKHHLAVPYKSTHAPKGVQSGDGVLNLPLQSAK